MTTTKQLVERFQELHVNKYGIEISYEVAEHQLKELAELVRLTSREDNLHIKATNNKDVPPVSNGIRPRNIQL